MLGRPPIFHDVLADHFEELESLWEQREANLRTPDWTLQDLAEHEDRIEAHLQGLRLGELHSVELCRERLDAGGSEGVAAAMVLECMGPKEQESLLELFERSRGETLVSLASALRHSSADWALPKLESLLVSASPEVRLAAADVLSFRGAARVEVPPTVEDEALQPHAWWVAGRTRSLSIAEVEQGIECADSERRRDVLEAACSLGREDVLTLCRRAATRSTDPDPVALRLLGLLGGPADEPIVRDAIARPDLAPAALDAAGAMGRVGLIPDILETLRDPALGIAGASAYRRITGAPALELERELDDYLNDEEGDALQPDVDALLADWDQRQSSLSEDTTWQLGRPFVASDTTALASMTLQVRHDHWLLARAEGLAPLCEPSARARLQLEAVR